MKKIALIIINFLIFTQLFSQEVPIDIVNRVNSVNYIFEGEVIKSNPYYSNDGQYIYTSNTIEITKLLKGNIECGTIEIITIGGDMGDLRLNTSHTLKLNIGSKGIFLCSQTNRPVSVIDFYQESNIEKLEASLDNQININSKIIKNEY
jgi:hypothetical protein